MFSQTFDYRDLLVILVLVLLEGVLSIDNALVLGLLARRLPPALRRKALSYGLIGALVFRIIAVVLAGWVLRWHIVLLLGGGYLVYLSLKHLLFTPKRFRGKHGKAKERIEHESASVSAARFWPTVASIELTDIAFALDSILAAIALVADETPAAPGKPHPKMWVVITGGMIGVVLVRAAAAAFIKLLDKFPRFESAAYLLVLLIGVKLIVDWSFNPPGRPPTFDFSSPRSAAFWIFWGLMGGCFCVGFLPGRKSE